MVVSCHMGTWNQTPVLYKSKTFWWPLGHISCSQDNYILMALCGLVLHWSILSTVVPSQYKESHIIIHNVPIIFWTDCKATNPCALLSHSPTKVGIDTCSQLSDCFLRVNSWKLKWSVQIPRANGTTGQGFPVYPNTLGFLHSSALMMCFPAILILSSPTLCQVALVSFTKLGFSSALPCLISAGGLIPRRGHQILFEGDTCWIFHKGFCGSPCLLVLQFFTCLPPIEHRALFPWASNMALQRWRLLGFLDVYQ